MAAQVSKAFLILLLVAGPACVADVPCPLKLIDGQLTQDGVRLTFRNTGKLAIQEVELDCTPLDGKRVRRELCRDEPGLFYPGSQYDLDFEYDGVASGKTRAVQLTLNSARLSDGSNWKASRHESCKALKIYKAKRR